MQNKPNVLIVFFVQNEGGDEVVAVCRDMPTATLVP